MCTNQEQRICARFDYESTIRFNLPGKPAFHAGQMYDYSRSGLYFETDTRLLDGQELDIRIEQCPFPAAPEIIRAEVRWCAEIQDAVVLYRFGVGVQFTKPIKGPMMHKWLRVIRGGQA
jgi:hypothetical protein